MFNAKRYKPPKNINMALFKEKLNERQIHKEKLSITVTPNPKCALCHGDGRVKVVTNKIPGMQNIILGGGQVRLQEFCPDCVIPRAQKESRKLKMVEGEEFNIALANEVKTVADPLAENRSVVVEPELEEVKDEQIQKDTPEAKW
jgi:hypothetical protein